MKILRDARVRKAFILCLCLTPIGGALGFLGGLVSAVISFCTALIISGVYFTLTVRRIKEIERLSEKIDGILFHNEKMEMDEYCEGELSVLASEIYKMTVRLREQADALKKDKEDLSELIADISHQLKTPLTSMGLIASLASSDNTSPQKRKELLNSQTLLIERMQWLISSLLKLSAIDAGTVEFSKEKISARELINKSCEPFLISMDIKGQSLEVVCSDETLHADLKWTAEAVGNVIKNCTEHTPDGGKVTVKVTENPLYTEISVSDTGSGISQKDLPHIFERFYKGENASSQSAGIGLALARTITVSQDGTLTASNGKNGGAEFVFRFYRSVV